MSLSIRSLAAAVGLALASGGAVADDPRVSEPVRECWQETSVASNGPFFYNHIGGALIDGAIGANVSRDRQRQLYGEQRVTQERCDVRYRDSWEERVDGYEVTYEYAGREYVTQMPYDPGERIRVRVDVTPATG